MKHATAKKRIAKALKNPCPDRYTIDGKENCFSSYINNDNGTEYLLIDKIQGDNLLCREWCRKEQTFKTEIHIKIKDTIYKNYQITHGYKGTIHFYNGLENFRYSNILKNKILKEIELKRFALRQYIFNQRNILVEERINVLRTLVDLYLEKAKKPYMYEQENSFSYVDYLNSKNDRLWVKHPDSNNERARVKLILESLKQTGDLEKTKNGYAVTPKALTTLANYDEEERKHNSLLRLQYATIFLTVVIAVGTIAQAWINYIK